MPFINDRITGHKEHVVQHSKRACLEGSIRQSRFSFDPEQAIEHIKKSILGQQQALDSIEGLLYQVKADIAEANRPLSVNLLIGPTGVGKTETAQLIAEAISGSVNNLCRIDMNTLSQSHYAAAISGAPPGYVGSKEGYTLLDQAMIKGSFSIPSVVLFDELEKASREVIRALLNVLDTGKLMLASGNQTIDFSNSIIFMTSNLVKDEPHLFKLLSYLGRSAHNKRREKYIDRILNKHLDPEFINRIDRTIYYSPIAKKHAEKLCRLALDRLVDRLSSRAIMFSYSSEIVEYLVKLYQRHYSARGVERLVRTRIEPQVARAILAEESCKRFRCVLTAGRISVLST